MNMLANICAAETEVLCLKYITHTRKQKSGKEKQKNNVFVCQDKHSQTCKFKWAYSDLMYA